MRTCEEQVAILEHLIALAKQQGSAGETEWVEFKTNTGESRCSVTYERVGDYISGLSNSACIKDKAFAYLVLGVENNTWEIVGTNLRMSTQKINNQDYELWLRRCLNPIVDFEIEEFTYKDKNIVMFIIPAAAGEPIGFKGVEYIRIGSNLTKLSDFRDYKRVIYNSQVDWSANIVPNATIEDLDRNAILKARELFANKHEDLRTEMEDWDDVKFLNKAKIIRKNEITNSAIVLLGKPESEVLISPAAAKIRWILKDYNGLERDYDVKTCPLILAIDEIYSKIRNLKYRYINPALLSLFPDEFDTYEPYVMREALNNAIAHQDYSQGGMINVVEFEDKLVFTNLGHFIPLSIKSVLDSDAPEEKYRNKFLAQSMVELKMVDTIGSGIRRMFNHQRRKLFPMPDYDLSENKVKVTIIGKVLDVNYSMLLTKHKDLSLSDIEMLNRLQFNKKLTESEISYLRKRKLIEGRKPNIFLAKPLAQIADKKIEYTKNKGLNDYYYKSLIVKALKEHKHLGRKDFDELLIEKLPDILSYDQKKTKVGNLLTALRSQGKIMLTSRKLWILSEL